MLTIRSATEKDAERFLEIYDYYVRETAITFEYDTPSPDEFRQRMRKIMTRYPYLAAEENGIVLGYAYAGTFIGRAAYDRCAEVTIYLDRAARGRGAGRRLYEALEDALRKMGILNLYACIGLPRVNDNYLTTNSADSHAHIGYVQVGRFHNCGHKFGNWYDMIWMEKIIGEHTDAPAPVMAYEPCPPRQSADIASPERGGGPR